MPTRLSGSGSTRMARVRCFSTSLRQVSAVVIVMIQCSCSLSLILVVVVVMMSAVVYKGLGVLLLGQV